MPLIRCDYSQKLINDQNLQKLVKLLHESSTTIFDYNEQDAQDKISIFSTPYGPFDHSTASAEIEIRALERALDHPTMSHNEIRLEYLKRYEDWLLPYIREVGLQAPILLTMTFESWEVNVLSAEGSKSNFAPESTE